MNFNITDTAERWAAFWKDVTLVMPEIWLVIAMCVVILVPFLRRDNVRLPMYAALGGLALALVALTWNKIEVPEQVGSELVKRYVSTMAANASIFGDMLVIDPFSQFFKFLLILFTALVISQWWLLKRERPAAVDTPDFFCLLLGAVFGMSLMASANNLLMILIATEAASLPSFALAGFAKHTRRGTEGSLKYVIFGAAASAVSIYGMSLIYGTTGSLNLDAIAASAQQAGGMSPLMAVGMMAMFAGFAFKLSAVPLHFWCPDVFQGAPIPVTTFLSVVSKGAALVMVVRVLHAFGVARAPSGNEIDGLFTGMAVGVGILGGVTATWGNLVAFHQNNFKRLLAYSSIAHAGYMIMGAAAMIYSQKASDDVAGALLFYLLVYIFMNLGAFTVVGIIAERTGSEDVRDYAGLIKRSPAMAMLLTLFLLSLFGMPGLGGFLGKIYLMKAMGQIGVGGFVLIAALLINTLISLYFYMRPVYYMVFVPDTRNRPSFPLGAGLAILVGCAIALVWTGIHQGAIDLANGYAVLRDAHKPAPLPPKPVAPAVAEAAEAIVPAATVQR